MAQIANKHYCKNLEETKKVAIGIAKATTTSKIYAFYGDLGAGKTTFIKTVLSFFDIPAEQIQSPTYSYLHSYENLYGGLNLYHFDLYRLKSEKEFLALGFEEYLINDGVCFIEWAEKIKPILPGHKTVNICIQHTSELNRIIEISHA